MPITVVTHRDDVGAPTSRDVLAAADRFQITDSNLEVFAGRQLVAHYPSGNWLNAFVDEPVRVLTTSPLGKVESSWVEVDPGVNVHLDFLDGFLDLPVPGARGTSSSAAGVAPGGPPPWLDVPRADGGLEVWRSSPRPTQVGPEREVPVDRESFQTVAFTPKDLTVEGAEPPVEDEPVRMRQLRFRPRIYRAAHADGAPPDADESSGQPRMQRIVFRPKVYRAARPAEPGPEPEPSDEGADPTD